MKIEVNCRQCGMDYLLDSAFAGTTLPCPSCGAPSGLVVAEAPKVRPALQPERPAPGASRPSPEPAAAVRVAPTSRPVTPIAQPPSPPSPADDPPAGTRATPVPAPIRPSESEEVVCPRCKLHFVPRRATAEVAQAARRTVLVVEDMEYFRETAAEALSSTFEVKTASTVAEARNVLAGGGIDLMVLDLTLDGGDFGFDLLRALPGKPFPILIYTDKDESEMYGDSWEDLQRLGADDLVIKGMNVGESLMRKVCSLLGQPWDEDE